MLQEELTEELRSLATELDELAAFDMGGPQSSAAEYAQPELYRAVHKDEIAANNWSLVPSRYIEFVDRDTELDYKAALKTAGAAASDLLKRQDENAKRLAAAFKALGVKL